MEQVEQLCGVLEQELQVCSALTEVLRLEQEAIAHYRAETILQSLERRAGLQSKLATLALERQQLARTIGAQLGRVTEHVSDLVPLLTEAVGRTLRRRMRDLRTALLAARSLERQNTFLARASLDHVDDVVQALRGIMPGARYGADAALTVPAASSGLSQRA